MLNALAVTLKYLQDAVVTVPSYLQYLFDVYQQIKMRSLVKDHTEGQNAATCFPHEKCRCRITARLRGMIKLFGLSH